MSPRLLSATARMAGSSLLRLQADERLVELVHAGHEPAFAAIVDRYRPDLVRYCARLLGEGRAEDAVQQALLNAHLAMTSNRNALQLRPWLYRIAHNAAVSMLRRSPAEAALPVDAPSPGAVDVDAEGRERLRAALAAIAALPEAQRDALVLQAIEGRSHDEIAAALGITPGAARQNLHRARMTLRAAVTALTPYDLLVRFALAGDRMSSGADLLTGTGAGASVTALKVGTGILAAGAIAGGATKLPVTPLHPTHRDGGAARAAEGAQPGDTPQFSVPAADRGEGRAGQGPGGRRTGHRSPNGRDDHPRSGRRRGDDHPGSSRHGGGGRSGDDHGRGEDSPEQHSSGSGSSGRRGSSDDGRTEDASRRPESVTDDSSGRDSSGSSGSRESSGSGPSGSDDSSGTSSSGGSSSGGSSSGTGSSGSSTSPSGSSGSGSSDSTRSGSSDSTGDTFSTPGDRPPDD